MSDRTTEIREALRRYDEWGLGKDALERYMAVAPLADAARAYADLLDSDPLIIQRDEMSTVLIAHQRMDNSGCLCGWHELGHSWAEHVVAAALAAVVDTPKEDR